MLRLAKILANNYLVISDLITFSIKFDQLKMISNNFNFGSEVNPSSSVTLTQLMKATHTLLIIAN